MFKKILVAFLLTLTPAMAQNWVDVGNDIFIDKDSFSVKKPTLYFNIRDNGVVKSMSTSCTKANYFYTFINNQPSIIKKASPLYNACLYACDIAYFSSVDNEGKVEIDWGFYKSKIENDIKANWLYAQNQENNTVEVDFRVLKDGSLKDLHIVKSSHNSRIDNKALEAVRKTAPFNPLPPEYKGEGIKMHFVFDYKNVLVDKKSVLKLDKNIEQ